MTTSNIKLELLDKIILALREAKKQGLKQFNIILDKVEDLLIGQLCLSYCVSQQYIKEAKKRIL